MANKPDYTISAINKFTREQGVIGAAWKNPGKEHITIRFNPFVVVPTGKDFAIALFPYKEEKTGVYLEPEPTKFEDKLPF